MKISQYRYSGGRWQPDLPVNHNADLLLSFGQRVFCEEVNPHSLLSNAFPNVLHVGCSGSGDIGDDDVFENELICTAISFDTSHVQAISANLTSDTRTEARIFARQLALQLPVEQLRYVLILCDGHCINASALVEGIQSALPRDIVVSGGLAGDDQRFETTLVWHNTAISQRKLVLCGFYGSSLQVTTGCDSGWQPFGPVREITLSRDNELLELDHQPALDLYKRYLGRFSKQLPSSAVQFPLSVRIPGEADPFIRTVVATNETRGSLLFADEMPVRSKVRLMKSTHEAMIDGAASAARRALKPLKGKAEFALHISCMGRRLVLGQRIFEELDALSETLGNDCPHTGFYSYGELSPSGREQVSKLQNQVISVTLFAERS